MMVRAFPLFGFASERIEWLAAYGLASAVPLCLLPGVLKLGGRLLPMPDLDPRRRVDGVSFFGTLATVVLRGFLARRLRGAEVVAISLSGTRSS